MTKKLTFGKQCALWGKKKLLIPEGKDKILKILFVTKMTISNDYGTDFLKNSATAPPRS